MSQHIPCNIWFAKRANEINIPGEIISSSDFSSSNQCREWLGATVPGTVLSTLVENGVLKDPFYGINNEVVPDIAVVGKSFYTYWFRTTFHLETNGSKRHVWLNFRGINYSATIYLNGVVVPSLPRGMFLRRQLNITEQVKFGEDNHIAVLVLPPDHPGRIEFGGQGGDHDIAKDVTAQFVEGWDWIIPIADRNTGIWDRVDVKISGPISICDPHLVCSFHDFTHDAANLHVSLELVNSSSDDLSGKIVLCVSFLENDSNLVSVEGFAEDRFKLSANSVIVHSFSPMVFSNPKLWWPNGMGASHLYDVEISVELDDLSVSDSWSHKFGFRSVKSYIDSKTGGRTFLVNGCRSFIRGANWIASDGMLRLSPDRYETEVRFHAVANLNMIRVWGGALAERPEFYEACDKYGILVWQEFWITGDCNGRGLPPSDPNWPLDHDLFLKCAVDTVKLIRNHASLAIWVGGNEATPAPDLNEALKKLLEPYSLSNYKSDPSLLLDGTRDYVEGSLWGGFGAGNGDFSDGPYGILNPEDFFEPDFYNYGFNPEIGSVGCPEASTVRAVLDKSHWDPPAGYGCEGNDGWKYHKYIPYSRIGFTRDLIGEYGEVTGLDDFCEKAQIVSYVQYKSLIESWNSKMWEKYTGVLIWKSQNPWPGFRGQLYDWFLDVCGGLYGVKSAAEPIHVQLNLYSRKIEAVNSSGENLKNVFLVLQVFEITGEVIEEKTSENFSLEAFKTLEIFQISAKKGDVKFYLLKLFDLGGKIISRNVYWLAAEQNGNFASLSGPFRDSKLSISAQVFGTKDSLGNYNVKLKLQNETPNSPNLITTIAFFLRLSVKRTSNSDREIDSKILGAFYSDNYFTLFSKEEKVVDISFSCGEKERPYLEIKGWNLRPKVVEISFS